MVVPVEVHPIFKPGIPVPLFSGSSVGVSLEGFGGGLYDPAPGGQRFAVVRQPEAGQRNIVLLQGWLEDQERK
jgi:hypothetical protein